MEGIEAADQNTGHLYLFLEKENLVMSADAPNRHSGVRFRASLSAALSVEPCQRDFML